METKTDSRRLERVVRRLSPADSLSVELEKVRAQKQPTRRGIMMCGAVMGEMLRFGWHRDQLDALELMFWLVRDANGRVIKNPPNQRI